MKTTFLFLVVTFFACQSIDRDPVKDALSTEGRTANIVHVIPTSSACPDSLEWIRAGDMYKLQIGLVKARFNAGFLSASGIDSVLSPYRAKHDSAYQRILSSPRSPGFSLVRYTVNREPDTLTAVLDPSFRVVWPR